MESLLQPVINGMGYELLGIDYGGRGRRVLLRVYIDQHEGIALSDCEKVSRRISALMDVENMISGHYDLEVSSPGLDRPLFKPEHYERFISHRVKIVMLSPQRGRRRFTGILQAFENDTIVVLVDNEVYELPFVDVASTRLVPEF